MDQGGWGTQHVRTQVAQAALGLFTPDFRQLGRHFLFLTGESPLTPGSPFPSLGTSWRRCRSGRRPGLTKPENVPLPLHPHPCGRAQGRGAAIGPQSTGTTPPRSASLSRLWE